jgi:hypothetical protein
MAISKEVAPSESEMRAPSALAKSLRDHTMSKRGILANLNMAVLMGRQAGALQALLPNERAPATFSPSLGVGAHRRRAIGHLFTIRSRC